MLRRHDALRWLTLGICFLLPVIFFVWIPRWATAVDYDHVRVVYVYDGDTVRLANGEKVRLIGIDCPEEYESDKLYRDARRSGQDIAAIEAQGRRAARFTRRLVDGKTVRVEFDKQKRDRYGRLLAYLFIPSGELRDVPGYRHFTGKELFLNAEVMRQGYARPLSIAPNLKYRELFRRLFEEAEEHRRGLWSPSPKVFGPPLAA